MEKMQAKVGTPEGQKLYAQRKTIVEPVFGQIKGARGFRRFSFRGLLKIGARQQYALEIQFRELSAAPFAVSVRNQVVKGA